MLFMRERSAALPLTMDVDRGRHRCDRLLNHVQQAAVEDVQLAISPRMADEGSTQGPRAGWRWYCRTLQGRQGLNGATGGQRNGRQQRAPSLECHNGSSNHDALAFRVP